MTRIAPKKHEIKTGSAPEGNGRASHDEWLFVCPMQADAIALGACALWHNGDIAPETYRDRHVAIPVSDVKVIRDALAEHVGRIATVAHRIAAAVKVVSLPDYRPSFLGDWLDGNGGIAELIRRVEEADDYEPTRVPSADGAPARSRFHLTDLGNGERLAWRHGDVLHYCAPWKKWLVWDGRRWAHDALAVQRCAKETVRSIYAEAEFGKDKDERSRIVAWAKASEENRRVRAMVERAQSEEGIGVLPGQLDQDPWLLNCLNGTLDLRTGRLRPHRREDYLTQLCPITYDDRAACPMWEDGLKLIFGGNTDLIGYVLRLCGLALTGDVSEQVLPILHGTGENGKSTILTALLEMMGPDYAMKAPRSFLMTRRHEAHPTELADLFGKRLVVAIETGEGSRIDEVLVKELTGSDRIRTRRMREDFWEFGPTHKVLLCTNHKPSIRGTDHAIWRRIHLIPFDVKIPPQRKDPHMPSKLRAEYAGILAWCVRGCLDRKDLGGLDAPQKVLEATETYRAEEDVLAGFIASECVSSPQNHAIKVKASALYAAYRTWVERSGLTPITLTDFGKRITEKGYEKKPNNGIWYLGIGLRADDRSPQEWNP